MKQQLKILLFTLLGNTMLAFAVCAFIVPQDFMLGGSSGIALTTQYFLPVRLSVITAVMTDRRMGRKHWTVRAMPLEPPSIKSWGTMNAQTAKASMALPSRV